MNIGLWDALKDWHAHWRAAPGPRDWLAALATMGLLVGLMAWAIGTAITDEIDDMKMRRRLRVYDVYD